MVKHQQPSTETKSAIGSKNKKKKANHEDTMLLPVEENVANKQLVLVGARKLSLFLDGLTRGVTLPLGPILVYQVVTHVATASDQGVSEQQQQQQQSLLQPTVWRKVGFYLSLVVAAQTLGRALGSCLSNQHTGSCFFSSSRQRLHVGVARLAGVALTLHILTLGPGMKSESWMIMMRFGAAVLAGYMYGMTKSVSLSSAIVVDQNKESSSFPSSRHTKAGNVDSAGFAPAQAAATAYLSGFACSVFVGGYFLSEASAEHFIVQTLTDASQHSFAPLFFLISALVMEFLFRRYFAWLSKKGALLTTSRASLPVSPSHRHGVNEDDESLLLAVQESRSTVSSNSTLRTRNAGRPRGDSQDSMDDDEFFDCVSLMSEEEEDGAHGLLESSESSLVVDSVTSGACTSSVTCVYNATSRRCLYKDGSPSFVPPGESPGTIPKVYLEFYNHNVHRARKAWICTQRWRRDEHVWKILAQPHRNNFSKIKQAYPHILHGHSRDGHPVMYERPGLMHLKKLFRGGCEVSDMIRHYIFVLEYMSNCLCSRDEIKGLRQQSSDSPTSSHGSSWGFFVVMDIRGAGLSHLSGDVVKYLRTAGDINSSHYPLSTRRIFVVNSPFWAAGAWSGIKKLLPESVQVDLLSERSYLDALRRYIDDDQIPQEYGGRSPFTLGLHPYEVELRKFVEENIDIESNMSVDDAKVEPIATTVENNNIDVPNSTPEHRVPLSLRHRGTQRNSEIRSVSSRGSRAYFNGMETDFLIRPSLLLAVCVALQAALEILIPIWVLSPAGMGGLGYSTVQAASLVFCVSLVLMWAARWNCSMGLHSLQRRVPLTAFRLGLGAEIMLLMLLAALSSSAIFDRKMDSIPVMVAGIAVCSCLAAASNMARAGAESFHRQIASEGFARLSRDSNRHRSTINCFGHSSDCQGASVSDCESGRLSTTLSLAAEVVGVILSGPLCFWSLQDDREASFDISFLLLSPVLTGCILYICSLKLPANESGGSRARFQSRTQGRALFPDNTDMEEGLIVSHEGKSI